MREGSRTLGYDQMERETNEFSQNKVMSLKSKGRIKLERNGRA